LTSGFISFLFRIASRKQLKLARQTRRCRSPARRAASWSSRS